MGWCSCKCWHCTTHTTLYIHCTTYCTTHFTSVGFATWQCGRKWLPVCRLHEQRVRRWFLACSALGAAALGVLNCCSSVCYQYVHCWYSMPTGRRCAGPILVHKHVHMQGLICRRWEQESVGCGVKGLCETCSCQHGRMRRSGSLLVLPMMRLTDNSTTHMLSWCLPGQQPWGWGSCVYYAGAWLSCWCTYCV